jgi:hypothetical protein
VKEIIDWRSPVFEQMMIDRSAFCRRPIFHAIIIVAPLHTSKPI